jgi:hypothetical protein
MIGEFRGGHADRCPAWRPQGSPIMVNLDVARARGWDGRSHTLRA